MLLLSIFTDLQKKQRHIKVSGACAPEKLQVSCLLVNCSLVQAVEFHSIGTGGSMQLHLWSQE